MDKSRIIPSPSTARKPHHGGYPGNTATGKRMTAAEWLSIVRDPLRHATDHEKASAWSVGGK